jgi:hypothetical protein
VTSPVGLPLEKPPPSGGSRTLGGAADQQITTVDFGHTPEALLRSPRAASAAGGGQGAARGSRPGAEKAPHGTRLRLPAPSVSPTASAAGGQGEPLEGSHRLDAAAACRHGEGTGRPEAGLRHGRRALFGMASPGWSGRYGTLKGKQSPWKDRVAGRWQRRLVTTDSSAEQSLEVGCSVRFRRARTPAHFGGCGRSATEFPPLRQRSPDGSPRAADRYPPERPSGVELIPGGGLIAHPRHRRFGTGTDGQFHVANSGASAPGHGASR